jgi:hypothetical protein
MSISGAVAELNKEIERLTKIRDSLLQGSAGGSQPAVGQPIAPQTRKYVRSAKTPAKSSVPSKKSTAAKKSVTVKPVPVKVASSVKKRVISAATRKKMSDAAKARAAKKLEAAK